jgi:hypothetical protein
MQPYNYTIQAQDPFQSYYKGYELGQAEKMQREQIAMQREQAAMKSQALQQKMMQDQAAAERAQSQAMAAQGLMEKIRSGTANAADIQSFAISAPKDQSEAALKVFESMNKEQQQGTLGFTAQVLSAFGSKKPEIGIQLLNDRALAERNSGREDQAKAYETWAKIAESDPVTAQVMIAPLVGQLPGGDKVIEAWTKAQGESRARELQPFNVKEKRAESIIKEAQAKFAPEKFGLEIGLTEAQIAQAKAAANASRASAAASSADASRKTAEARQITSGIIPADKRPEAEGKFRKEYSDQTKVYQDVKSSYGRVLASKDSAVGDIALIFGYMKMLDPGSVVREGEFATAQNAAGVPDRVVNIYNRLVDGERLTESQRSAFKGQAESLYKTAKKDEEIVRTGIERIAKGYGLNTENIFYADKEKAPEAPKSESVTVGGKTYTRPDNFTDAQWNAYKKAVGVK